MASRDLPAGSTFVASDTQPKPVNLGTSAKHYLKVSELPPGGYLLHAALTTKLTFDLKADDVFWCTADIGWVTGHSYITYGPLLCGATTMMFEGVPTHPDPGRFWQLIDHEGRLPPHFGFL